MTCEFIFSGRKWTSEEWVKKTQEITRTPNRKSIQDLINEMYEEEKEK